MSTTVDVAIFGGGVAGLACALRVRSLMPSASIVVIEASDKPGGKVCGDKVDGCVIDGGPDLFIEAKLADTHAFAELPISSELIPVNAASLPTFRRHAGKLSPMSHVMADGLVTMRSGMHDIVQLMVAAMPEVRLLLGERITTVKRTSGEWRTITGLGTAVQSSAIVCALPATVTAELFESIVPRLADAAATVRYMAMTTVSAAWDATDVPGSMRGTGYVETEVNDGGMSACTWTSSKIPIRSPYDTILVRGYVRTAAPASATCTALAGFREALGITAAPLWTRTFAWRDGIPEYPDGHSIAVENLRAELAPMTDLALAGAAWDGVGIGDCIRSGERAAERVADALRKGSAPPPG